MKKDLDKANNRAFYLIVLLSGLFAIGLLGTSFGIKISLNNGQNLIPEYKNQTIYVNPVNNWDIFHTLRFNKYIDINRMMVDKFQFLGLNIDDNFLKMMIAAYLINEIKMDNASYYIFFTRSLYPFPEIQPTYDYLFNKNGQWFILWDIPEELIHNGMPHVLLLQELIKISNYKLN